MVWERTRLPFVSTDGRSAATTPGSRQHIFVQPSSSKSPMRAALSTCGFQTTTSASNSAVIVSAASSRTAWQSSRYPDGRSVSGWDSRDDPR